MPASVLLGLAIVAMGLGGGFLAWLDAMQREATFLTAVH